MFNRKASFCLLLILIINTFAFAKRMHQQIALDLNALRQAQLTKHNTYRATHGSPALVLDDALNTAAQNYANYLQTIGGLTHSPAAIAGTYGQNLYYKWGSPTVNYVGGTASTKWYDQVAYYNYDTFLTTTPGKAIGHFTALVWKASTKVGFGFSSASQSKLISGKTWNGQNMYVVANYQETGNVQGQYAVNVLRPLPV